MDITIATQDALPPGVTLTVNGAVYVCRPMETVGPESWQFPVGDADYPPSSWYCATWHDPTGARNGGYRHTGIDINLDVAPWGDIERKLGLSVYAIAPGAVTFSVWDWYGNPMIVVRHEHEGAPLYTRYAHIVPVVKTGRTVEAGELLGSFADWHTGDHLHLDMSRTAYEREWFTPGMIDPVPVLKAHLDPAIVEAMLRKGD